MILEYAMSRVFANGPRDWGSIPDRVIPKTQKKKKKKKMVLDAALLNTQHYKVKIKDKVEQSSRGWPEGSLFNSYYTEV